MNDESPDGEARPTAAPFKVRARLFVEPLLIEEADGSAHEVELPVLSVSFDYDGVVVRATDPGDRLRRDRTAEARALRLLESFGAVEIGYIEDAVPPVDSCADYLVVAQGNVHSWCSFTAYALPRLRNAGWQIEVDPDYPYRLVEADPEWVASVDADSDRGDWFTLELGIDIGGRRVSLLPALLELLERAPDHASLNSLLRLPARYRALPAGGGAFVAIEPGRLHALLKVLLELYRGDQHVCGSRLRFARAQAGSLPRLRHAAGHPARGWRWEGRGAELCADALLLEIGYSPAAAPLDELRAELRGYQRDGLGWLQQLRAQGLGGILADDMGLGKTLQTIAHLLMEHRSGRASTPSLIVMPKSLVTNWQRELSRFAPCLSVGVLHGPRRHRTRAEVLDKDAYQAFKETSLYDQETAAKLRHLLSQGGSRPGMDLYREFRGRDPEITSLLEARGLTGN
jgi:non-specific serine/threonine protein kinase